MSGSTVVYAPDGRIIAEGELVPGDFSQDAEGMLQMNAQFVITDIYEPDYFAESD